MKLTIKRLEWLSDNEPFDCALSEVREMAAEILKLRSALKQARDTMRLDGVTLRGFSQLFGVSPTQMSQWTADDVTTEPDFIN